MSINNIKETNDSGNALEAIDGIAHGMRHLKSCKPVHFDHRSCVIDEECDTYGFSLLSHAGDVDRDAFQYREQNVVDEFRKDVNWNNPGAVQLMCRAFGLDKADEYRSSLLPDKSGFGYLALRAEQHKLWSVRLVNEGEQLEQQDRINDSIVRYSEAIRYDYQSIEALLARARANVQLKNVDSARRDYQSVLQIQPSNELAMQGLVALSAFLNRENYSGESISTSSSTYRGNVSSSGNLHLIGKLQQALSVNNNALQSHEYLENTPSTSSRSSSSSDSDDSRSDASRGGNSKKRKSRHHKSSKSSGKKHKRHKKDRHSHKKKKKHKHDK